METSGRRKVGELRNEGRGMEDINGKEVKE